MADQIESTPVLPTQIERGPHEGYLGAFLRSVNEVLIKMILRSNGSLPKDGTEAMAEPLPLSSYTIATLPTASEWEGGVIYVSDGAAGAKFRGSDGSSWVNLG